MRDMTQRREGTWYARKHFVLHVYCETKRPPKADPKVSVWRSHVNLEFKPGDIVVFVRDRLPEHEAWSGHDIIVFHENRWKPAYAPRMGNPQWNKKFER